MYLAHTRGGVKLDGKSTGSITADLEARMHPIPASDTRIHVYLFFLPTRDVQFLHCRPNRNDSLGVGSFRLG